MGRAGLQTANTQEEEEHLLNASMDNGVHLGVLFTLETPTFTVCSHVCFGVSMSILYVHSKLAWLMCAQLLEKGVMSTIHAMGGDKAWHACVHKRHLNWTLGSVPGALV